MFMGDRRMYSDNVYNLCTCILLFEEYHLRQGFTVKVAHSVIILSVIIKQKTMRE